VIYLYEKILGVYLVLGGLISFILYREDSLSYFLKAFFSGITFLSYLSSGFMSSSLLKMNNVYLGEQT